MKGQSFFKEGAQPPSYSLHLTKGKGVMYMTDGDRGEDPSCYQICLMLRLCGMSKERLSKLQKLILRCVAEYPPP